MFLQSLGDVVPLELEVEPHSLRDDIRSFEDRWVPYNPSKAGNRRWGLSLTSLDGGTSGIPDLTSLKEYNAANGTSYAEDDFQTPTPVLKASAALSSALEKVAPLGRTHLLRVGKGGFFPPHRDTALLDPECFRLIVNLNYTQNGHALILDDRQRYLQPGLFYFLDTTLAHSLFSFRDYAEFIVVNLPLREESVQKVVDLLADN